MLKPVQKVNLTTSVYEQLRDHILTEAIAPGEALPSERQLSEMLGVNRSAVRESLKRLEQSGLIAIQHGGNTRVLDYRRQGGLHLLAAVVASQPQRLADVQALREALLPEIARAAAERANSTSIARLEMLARLLDSEDPEQRADLAMEFWDTVVDASDNVAFSLTYNAIRDLELPGEPPSPEEFADLANALAAGDTRGAALTTLHLVRR